MEFREGDSLEGSAHIPMYNPYVLPLNEIKKVYTPTFASAEIVIRNMGGEIDRKAYPHDQDDHTDDIEINPSKSHEPHHSDLHGDYGKRYPDDADLVGDEEEGYNGHADTTGDDAADGSG